MKVKGYIMANDVEKLVGILEEFDMDLINEACDRIENGKEIYRMIEDDAETTTELETDGYAVMNLEDMPSIERIVEDNNLLAVYFLEVGANKEKSVARIVIPSVGRATGFLISPTILLTNNHVFGSSNSAKNAKIQFNYQKEADGTDATVDEYTTDPDSLFYTNASLDFSIVRVAPRCIGLQPIYNQPIYTQPVYNNQPVVSNECMEELSASRYGYNVPNYTNPSIPNLNRFKCHSAGSKWGHINLNSSPVYALDQMVNIIQHPAGRHKEVALQKNVITNIYPTRVRYKTDTQRGSSGSPVFNNSWDLVALHHAGGERDSAGNWINNQGIRIDEIVKNLRSNFADTATGRQVLAELGITV